MSKAPILLGILLTIGLLHLAGTGKATRAWGALWQATPASPPAGGAPPAAPPSGGTSPAAPFTPPPPASSGQR